jgi:hypothetical protein
MPEDELSGRLTRGEALRHEQPLSAPVRQVTENLIPIWPAFGERMG